MADKSVGELIAAQSVTPTDLFVLEQNGTAKKLTGQVLENWLVSFADGHGGIQSIAKLSTSGLADTYRITLADTTTFDFVVNNGRGITGISKTSTSGLVDTYTITYNNGTTSKFTVTNGAKGDKGDNAYVWIKYASQEPTESSNSMGDIPDNWIGIYSGNASTAPTDWKQYKWFKHKGEKGDTGNPATLVSRSVTYQVGDSGSIIPSGAWNSSIPVVPQGKYLWTKTELKFNSGEPIVSYSVARMGIDGSGSVSSVAGVYPDATGNVTLTAADVGALAVSGGDMTGEIRMNGQPISGLNDPTEDTQAARKGYVDAAKADANAYTDASVRKAAPRNLLDNSDFRNPVNQRGKTSYADNGYTIDRFKQVDSALTVSDGYINFATNADLAYKRLSQVLGYNLEANRPYTIAMYAKVNDVGSYGVFFRPATADGTGVSGLNGLRITDTTTDFTWYVYAFTPTDNTLQMCEILATKNEGSTVDVDIKYMCCYAGIYTAETLPEYQPKGYGAELAECYRYYKNLQGSLLTVMPYSGGGSALCAIPVPIEMRIMPTLNIKSVEFLYGGGIDKAPTIRSVSKYNSKPGHPVFKIDFTAVQQNVSLHMCYMLCNAELSADL